ncbi:MAG: hypothetical protein ACRC7I_13585 [Selenomonadaceae bacterium]
MSSKCPVISGNPAHIIKKRFDDEKIELLLKLRWWSWDEEKIFENLEKLVFANDLAILEKLLEGSELEKGDSDSRKAFS